MRYCQRLAWDRMAAMVAATSLSFKQLGIEAQRGAEVYTRLKEVVQQIPEQAQNDRQP